MKRIVVIGTTGSGKSTLAAQLAQRLEMPFASSPTRSTGQPNWQQAEPRFSASASRKRSRRSAGWSAAITAKPAI